uniref:NADH dehydrogenase subunit 6 n=1 Tax=Meloidogyne incognita TaxID=6306 RepID=A0A914KNI7_MELIC
MFVLHVVAFGEHAYGLHGGGLVAFMLVVMVVLVMLMVVGGSLHALGGWWPSSCSWWPADVMLECGRARFYSMHWWWLVYMLILVYMLFLMNPWPAQQVVWMVWTKQNMLHWMESVVGGTFESCTN